MLNPLHLHAIRCFWKKASSSNPFKKGGRYSISAPHELMKNFLSYLDASTSILSRRLAFSAAFLTEA
ncbi:unnamed protein product [Rhizophagus irregularis]|nr:unnamed protein product [Rhizophagus irregularis]